MDHQKENISPKQFSDLVSLFTIGSAVLFIPATLTGIARQDAWLSVIVAIAIGIFYVFLYSKGASILQHRTFIEGCQDALGKIAGTAIGIMYLSFPFILCTFLLWDIGDFMVTQIIVQTPVQAIFIMFILTIVFSIRSGIESVARTAEIFVPWVFGLFFLILIFVIPSIQVENIQPVFTDGIRPILEGSYHLVNFPFLELSMFLMITKNVNDNTKIKKAYLSGFFKGAFVLFVVTTACVLVLGPDFTSRNAFPVYILGKKVAIGEFVQRIEVVIAIMWFLSIYFKLGLAFYTLVVGTSQLLGLKDYRPITLPFAMLLVTATTIMVPSAMFLVEFNKKAWGPFILLISVVIPLVILLTLKIKHNKKNQQSHPSQTDSLM